MQRHHPSDARKRTADAAVLRKFGDRERLAGVWGLGPQQLPRQIPKTTMSAYAVPIMPPTEEEESKEPELETFSLPWLKAIFCGELPVPFVPDDFRSVLGWQPSDDVTTRIKSVTGWTSRAFSVDTRRFHSHPILDPRWHLGRSKAAPIQGGISPERRGGEVQASHRSAVPACHLGIRSSVPDPRAEVKATPLLGGGRLLLHAVTRPATSSSHAGSTRRRHQVLDELLANNGRPLGNQRGAEFGSETVRQGSSSTVPPAFRTAVAEHVAVRAEQIRTAEAKAAKRFKDERPQSSGSGRSHPGAVGLMT